MGREILFSLAIGLQKARKNAGHPVAMGPSWDLHPVSRFPLQEGVDAMGCVYDRVGLVVPR